MNVVPYSFNSDMLAMPTQVQPLPGKAQVIHFTVVNSESLVMLLDKIRNWFATRDEVLLVDHGTTASEFGFVVMEWQGFAIDPLFTAILEHEEIVDDYSIYTRDLED